jgi:5-enolpyruvylshikimate-3-phosphate synthase
MQVQATNTDLAASIGLFSAFLHACDSSIALDAVRAATAAIEAEESCVSIRARRGGAAVEYSNAANCKVLTTLSRALIYLDCTSSGQVLHYTTLINYAVVYLL